MLPKLVESRPYSSAAQAPKLTSEKIRQAYLTDMESNASTKFGTLKQYFPMDLAAKDLVVDCGSSTGLLTKYLRDEFPAQLFLGVDVSHASLEVAHSRDQSNCYVQADVFNLPLPAESVRVFILSSVLHELFSYATDKFSTAAVIKALEDLLAKTRADGRIIIKDPAKPENPREILVFSLSKDDGIVTSDQTELLATEPANLSTYSRYLRFKLQFLPRISDQEIGSINNENKLFYAPAWYLSEFLRHRNLSDSAEHWNSEMHEQYGVFTLSEFREVIQQLGCICLKLETSFNPTNHAAIKNGEVQIWSRSGIPVGQEDRLPTGIVAVFGKSAA